jgi:hypothetical protein
MPRETTPLRSVDVIEAEENHLYNPLTENTFSESQKIIPFSSSDNLEKIQERFLGKKDTQEDVRVFLTKDQSLLNQYYKLREKCYREDNGWTDYDGSENISDKIGRIVVAVKDEKVVGGMRLLMSDQMEEAKIKSPNEEPEEGFTYKILLEKIGMNVSVPYSEISAIAVAKECRDREVTKKMFDVLTKTSESYGCCCVLGVAVSVTCRDYRIAFNSIGYKLNIILNYPWIKQKSFGYVKRFPMIVPLNGYVLPAQSISTQSG